MATIGLSDLYYSPITEDSSGEETYGTPVRLAKAISVELEVELAEATLYADDAQAYIIKEFSGGSMTLSVDDIGIANAAALTGAQVDGNGVLVYTAEDVTPYVALAFRARRPDGNYRYFWLYRCKFGQPGTSLTTKGESVEFSTPELEATVMRRNKPDANGNHPWKAEVTSGDSGVEAATVGAWFDAVYEPTAAQAGG